MNNLYNTSSEALKTYFLLGAGSLHLIEQDNYISSLNMTDKLSPRVLKTQYVRFSGI